MLFGTIINVFHLGSRRYVSPNLEWQVRGAILPSSFPERPLGGEEAPSRTSPAARKWTNSALRSLPSSLLSPFPVVTPSGVSLIALSHIPVSCKLVLCSRFP